MRVFYGVLLKYAIGFIPLALSAKTFSAPLKLEKNLDQKNSVAGILTGKEGLASGLAHRHIIRSKELGGQVLIEADAGSTTPQGLDRLDKLTASLSLEVSSLIVDQPDLSNILIGIFEERNWWSAKEDKLSPENSDDVRKNMLLKDQLDQDQYSTISGRGEATQCEKTANQAWTCKLLLSLTVKDKIVERSLPVKIEQAGGKLTAKFSAEYRFTDFGIKPYSAMLGAIRVKDEFYLGGVLVVDTK